MTHDQACKNLCKQIVSALATCGNLRKEPDACGIFVAITCPKFLATILMLCGIFAGVQPLNLALQKSSELLVLADIPLYLDKTMSFLEKLKSTSKRPFSKKQISIICLIFFKEAMASYPPSSCTQSNQQFFEWEQFETNAYMSFLNAFMKEAEAALSQLDLWMIFNKLDPRALSKDLDLINMVWISLKNS